MKYETCIKRNGEVRESSALLCYLRMIDILKRVTTDGSSRIGISDLNIQKKLRWIDSLRLCGREEKRGLVFELRDWCLCFWHHSLYPLFWLHASFHRNI